jgi:LysM repeat protein
MARNINNEWQSLAGRTSPIERVSWNKHDVDIQSVVNEYNDYLSGTPGYQSLDWHLIKAMTFVETGPTSKDWDTEPLQSANAGDSGFADMMTHGSREAEIVPLNLQSAVQAPNASAFNNIAAGVGYLLYRAAHFGSQTVLQGQPKSIVTKSGDSLYGIAKDNGSTEAVVRALNPHVHFDRLKPGTTITVQKAGLETVIVGWDPIDPQSIAQLYNANGRGRVSGGTDICV